MTLRDARQRIAATRDVYVIDAERQEYRTSRDDDYRVDILF